MHQLSIALKKPLLRRSLFVVALLTLTLLTSALLPEQPTAHANPTSFYPKMWVTTFAAAHGKHQNGILNAGRNYVYCKSLGTRTSDNAGNYNDYWLLTDMDTGGTDFVSAYYLKKWGNNIAKDDAGREIPDCRPPTSAP